jgi:EAL domain-containing protein (putative c-di-GMP-specific phosphodiesterase class I)
MELAFDDFGAGQARLIELTETLPDYVKFDVQLIRGIHAASAGRQKALATLVRLVHDLGIATLAEGVELAEERAACHQLGFDLAQGFYLGRPEPLVQPVA